MASILKVDTLTGVTTAGSISVTGEGNSTTTNLQQGLAKAWCNFEQSSSHTVRDSLNVASLSDTGSGQTTTNYTNNFANDDYVGAGHSARYGATSSTAYWLWPTSKGTVVYSTSATSWTGGYSLGTSSDLQELDVYLALCTIHGDLA